MAFILVRDHLPALTLTQLSSIVPIFDAHKLRVAVIDLDSALDFFHSTKFDAYFCLIKQNDAKAWHWILMFKPGDLTLIFDSFLRSEDELRSKYDALRNIAFKVHSIAREADYQQSNAESCGWWCLLFFQLYQKRSWNGRPNSYTQYLNVYSDLENFKYMSCGPLHFYVTKNRKIKSQNEKELLSYFKCLYNDKNSRLREVVQFMN